MTEVEKLEVGGLPRRTVALALFGALGGAALREACAGTLSAPATNPPAGRSRRSVDDVISVKWFGARGTGTGDDTQAIQDAINAVISLPEGGTVYFPSGSYVVTGTLSANTEPGKHLRLTGEGYSSRLTITGVLEGIVADRSSNLEISRLRFDGEVARMIHVGGHPGSNGPVHILENFVSGATVTPDQGALTGISLANLDDVWVVGNVLAGNGHADSNGYGTGYEIAADASGNGSTRVHVRGNTVTCKHTAWGIALYNTSLSDVEGNTVDGGGPLNRLAIGDDSGYGILLYSGPTPTAANRVSGNTVRNTAGTGIYMQSSLRSVVSGNVLEHVCLNQSDVSLPVGAVAATRGTLLVSSNVIRNSRRSGVVIQLEDNVVQGNLIVSCAESGIQFNGVCRNVAVSGNVVRSTKHGIRTFGPEPITAAAITGNVVTNSRLDGIILLSASDCTVSQNVVAGAGNHLIIVQSGIGNIIEANRCTKARSDPGIDIRTENTLVAHNMVSHSFRGLSEQGACNSLIDNVISNIHEEPFLSSGNATFKSGNRWECPDVRPSASLVGGTATVHDPLVRGSDRIRVTRKTFGSAPGLLVVTSVVDGSFTVNSSNPLDDGEFEWEGSH